MVVIAMPFVRGACAQAAGSEWVLVATREGGFALIDGTCRHRGGPLRLGSCDGTAVRCPWHGTSFSWATLLRRSAPCVRVGGTVRAVLPGEAAETTFRRVYIPSIAPRDGRRQDLAPREAAHAAAQPAFA